MTKLILKHLFVNKFPSQQYVAPCVKEFEWEMGTRGLRMVGEFWTGIPVEVTQETGVVPRWRRAAIGTI